MMRVTPSFAEHCQRIRDIKVDVLKFTHCQISPQMMSWNVLLALKEKVFRCDLTMSGLWLTQSAEPLGPRYSEKGGGKGIYQKKVFLTLNGFFHNLRKMKHTFKIVLASGNNLEHHDRCWPGKWEEASSRAFPVHRRANDQLCGQGWV